MKIFVKITITLLISVSVIAILFIGALIYFKNNQTRILLNQIKKSLSTEVLTEKIDVSIFKHFPNVDVSLYDVKVFSANQFALIQNDSIDSKSLLSVKEIDISFDIFKLIRKKYVIKGITLKNGSASILINKLNKKNYSIFHTNASNDSLRINIQYIIIKNIKLTYLNELNNTFFESYISKSKFIGDLIKKNIITYLSLNYIKFSYNKNNVESTKPLNINLEINYNNNFYKIRNIYILYEKNRINLSGDYSGDNKLLNLNIRSKSFDVCLLKNFQNLSDEIKFLSGKINIIANLNVKIGKPIYISVTGSINLNNICFQIKNQVIEKSNGTLELEYYKGLVLKSNLLSFISNNSSVSLRDFYYSSKKDSLKSKIKAVLDAKDFNKFIKTNQLTIKKGNIEVESQVCTILKNTDLNSIVLSLTKNCELSFSDIFLNINGNELSNFHGNSKIIKNNIEVIDTKGKLNDYDIRFNGSIDGLISYFADSAYSLNVNGTLKGEYINVDTFLKIFSISEKSSKPLGAKINMRLQIQNLIYGYTSFSNFKSDLLYSNNQLYFKDINSNTLSGKLLSSNLEFEFRNDSLSLFSENTFYQIDIKKLFSALDNFEQNQLIAENISGKISGNCNLRLLWIKKILSKKNIYLNSNLELTNGVLENYKPLYKLSGIINLKELSSIKFETIKNKIIIQDNIVKIPQVDIRSSALNLSLSGQHSFNSKFEYHIKILLSELLSKKFKKQKEIKSEFGQVEVDTLHRISMYFKYFGDSLNSKFEYESKKAFNTFSGNIKTQNSNFIRLIKDELKTNDKQNMVIDSSQGNSRIESEFMKKTDNKTKKRTNHSIEWKDE